jgi:hypothetical protein
MVLLYWLHEGLITPVVLVLFVIFLGKTKRPEAASSLLFIQIVDLLPFDDQSGDEGNSGDDRDRTKK